MNDYEEEDWDRPNQPDPVDEYTGMEIEDYDEHYSPDPVAGQIWGPQWAEQPKGVVDSSGPSPTKETDRPSGTAVEFSRLAGRVPTFKEHLRLLQIKESLQLADDDAVWAIFVGLQYHLTLYESIPQDIKKLKDELLREIEKTAQKIGKLNLSIQQEKLDQTNKRLAGEFIRGMDRSISTIMAKLTKHIDQQFQRQIAAIPQPRFDMRSYLWFCVSGVSLLLSGILIGRFV